MGPEAINGFAPPSCGWAVLDRGVPGAGETTRADQPGQGEPNAACPNADGVPVDGQQEKRSPALRPGTASSRSGATYVYFSVALLRAGGFVPGLGGKAFTRGGILIDAGLDFLLG